MDNKYENIFSPCSSDCRNNKNGRVRGKTRWKVNGAVQSKTSTTRIVWRVEIVDTGAVACQLFYRKSVKRMTVSYQDGISSDFHHTPKIVVRMHCFSVAVHSFSLGMGVYQRL